MIFRYFESLIQSFRHVVDDMPPDTVWRFYLHFIRQVWPTFLAMLMVGLVGALIEVALFDFLGRIIDLVQHSTSPTDFFRQNWRALSWMTFVALIARPVFSALHDLLIQQAVNPGMTTMIRWQTHRYVLKQSLGFFHNDFAGRVAQRIMQTGNALRDSSVQIVDAMWHVIIYVVSALLLFAQADWRLMVPLILWVVGYYFALRYFVPRIKRRSVEAAEARSQLVGRVVDSYTNIATLKLFANTGSEQDYARQAMTLEMNRQRASNRQITAMDTTVTIMNGLLIVGTAGMALWLWSLSLITVGAITVATGLVIRINNMSAWIMWVVNGIFENIGTVQDGMKTIVQPRAVQDLPGARPLVVSQGRVQFDHVSFGYSPDQPVLDDLSLRIEPGERIGLVGASGAGKSTFVSLLLRMYDADRGVISVDGQDIAGVRQDSLRAQIGVVSQDTSLLHRSIRENVAYGRTQATDAEIWQALAKARATDFIERLVDHDGRRSLDALVGERGVKLSGGQRQRVAMARVLLKDAPILVLDEATSALDSEVEAAIQESLDELMKGKTVIAIAHRLSTIARMDRLVVMDQGRVIESGTHAQLLQAHGLYARLWQRQTDGFVGG